MREKSFYREEIGRRLRVLGVSPEQGQLEALAEMCGLLAGRGVRVGAVAKSLGALGVVRQVADGVSCLLSGRLDHGERVVDVGSGGGLPGIPLAILKPKSEFMLVEATRKKVDFCLEAAAHLGLANVSGAWARAEDYGRSETGRESFDVAVVRAVAELSVVEEYALPLVKVGGWLVAQKGRLSERELVAGEEAAELLGGGGVQVVEVPGGAVDRERCLVLIEKTDDTPERYPRRPGAAKKRPLGGPRVEEDRPADVNGR